VTSRTPVVLHSVQTGRIKPLGIQQVPSGFIKEKRLDRVVIGPLGLDGDQQADLISHGGLEKAVYGYALEQYDGWQHDFPALSDDFQPGTMGENLTFSGLEERDICVGDIHAVGSVQLQVCQPRQPCFKLAIRFNNKLLPKAMVRHRRSGWYYRVIQEGAVQAGDSVELVDRPNPGFPFLRLVDIVYHGRASQQELEQLARMPGLASQWRELAQNMLS
jgi:MOSC domain-containing protein YiiM